MGSGNGLATWSIASILSRATRETMWPSSVSARRCPVTTTLWAADRVRHLPCCCAQHATVEYWQGDPPRPQREFTTLVDDGPALLWPDGGPRPTPMEEYRCHSIEV